MVSDIHHECFAVDINAPAGSTLYSLSKASGTNIEVLSKVNHKQNNSISLHERLTIPLAKEKIAKNSFNLSDPTPIYYRVRKGDNLFRIATRAGHKVQDLMALNNKASEHLSPDEELLLGWVDWSFGERSTTSLAIVESKAIPTKLPIDKKKAFLLAEIRSYISQVPERSWANTIIVPALSDTETIEKVETFKEKGIAYWEKSKYQSKEMIVMHPHAKVDSKVSLYNPMLRRKVQAKVVSEMPKEAYPEDISIVISPSVASALGALDRRFQVEITYVQ